MFLLAGLMGLMAVSAVAYVEVTAEEETDDNDAVQERLKEEGGDAPKIDLISGTEMDDVLTGDAGMDRMDGGAGADVLHGAGGDDETRGGTGDDLLSGGKGDDTAHGEDDNDTLFGGDGDDWLMGHNDNDTLSGDDGDDHLQGSAGEDQLFGGNGDDALQGGLDNDTLSGDLGQDTLFGGWGDDVINGLFVEEPEGEDEAVVTATHPDLIDSDEGDFLNGGGGDDTILAGQGDTVTGGSGGDDIVLGDWWNDGPEAHILDYQPQEDSLLFVWDDGAAEALEPEVRLMPDPDNAGQLQLWMGDTMVAQIAGDDPLEDANVALIPLSALQGLGLAAA